MVLKIRTHPDKGRGGGLKSEILADVLCRRPLIIVNFKLENISGDILKAETNSNNYLSPERTLYNLFMPHGVILI